MADLLGGRRSITIVVHNTSATDTIEKGEPVEHGGSFTAIGGHPETIAGTFDPGAPAEPVLNVTRQIADASAAPDNTMGVARTSIAPLAEGEIVVWGPVLAKVLSNGAKAVGTGEAVSVAAQVGGDAHFDDDVSLPMGFAMEGGDWDTTPGTQNLTWLWANFIARDALGGS